MRTEEMIVEDVQGVLELLRPAIQADGGDVEFVDISEDGVVSVNLTGACVSCPLSQLTLSDSIEQLLKDRIPEVTGVVAANQM